MQNRGENCVIDCANAGIGGSTGSVSIRPNGDDDDLCEDEGRAVGTCFETAWMTACPYARNYDLGDNPSCQKATDVLCEAGFSAVGTNNVCCGDEVVTVTQCNVMKNYGEDCTIDCANATPKTNNVATMNSDSCDVLGNEVGQCFQSAWHPWAGCSYCRGYELPNNPTCEQATKIFCAAGFPWCCCGHEVVAVTECNIRQNRGEQCNINCNGVVRMDDFPLPNNGDNVDTSSAGARFKREMVSTTLLDCTLIAAFVVIYTVYFSL